MLSFKFSSFRFETYFIHYLRDASASVRGEVKHLLIFNWKFKIPLRKEIVID